jgi:tetracycline repressor-like protein
VPGPDDGHHHGGGQHDQHADPGGELDPRGEGGAGVLAEGGCGAGGQLGRDVQGAAECRRRGALERRIGDPVLARLVRLVGDGLFLEVLTGLPERSDPASLQVLLERMVKTG